ncbi:hypothetical protein CspHIS471_0308840 [Cutaneotrichosporon sp. HIS471]|nr:hypothetical protein CspHIS471_0308840 [Cutaneotrichosporon sp. HIS471]
MSESQLLKPSEIKANVPKLKNHGNFHQWNLKLRSQLRICGIVNYLHEETRPVEPHRITNISNLADSLKAALARHDDEIDAESPPKVLDFKSGESSEPIGVRMLSTDELRQWQYWATRESRTRSALEDTLDDSIAQLYNYHKSAHEMYAAICDIYRPTDDTQLADQYIRQLNALKLKKDGKSKDLLKHLTAFNELNSKIITYGTRLSDVELVRLFTGSLTVTERLHVGTAVNANAERTFKVWQREFANYVRLLQLDEPVTIKPTGSSVISATIDTSQPAKPARGNRNRRGRGNSTATSNRNATGGNGDRKTAPKTYNEDQIKQLEANGNWCKIHERPGHSTKDCSALKFSSKILEYSKLEPRDNTSTSSPKNKTGPNGKVGLSAAICVSTTSTNLFQDPTVLRFLIDNGSDIHLAGSVKHLINVRKLSEQKRVGLGFTNNFITITHIGDMPLKLEHGTITFHDVHVSSDTYGRILSQRQLIEEGWTVDTDDGMYMKNKIAHLTLEKLPAHPRHTFLSFDVDTDVTDVTTLEEEEEDENDNVIVSHVTATSTATIAATIAPIMLTRPDGVKLVDIHYRLGHLSRTKMLELINKGLVDGVTKEDVKDDKWKTIDCPHCALFKTAALPRTGPSPRGNAWGEMVHCDIKGPINPVSFDDQKYLCSIISDVARHREFHPIKTKAMAGPVLRQYIKVLQTMTGLTVKIVRTDGGGEFNSLEMRRFYADMGIQHHVSPPSDPALNGPIERFNRTAIEHQTAILNASNMDAKYWSYSAIYTSNILNMTTFLDDGRTAYEAFNRQPPNLANIRPFGERLHIRMRLLKKDDDNFTFERVRSLPGRVLSREPRFSAWWVLLNNDTITLGRDLYQFNPVDRSQPMVPFPDDYHDTQTDPDVDLTGITGDEANEDTIEDEEERVIQIRQQIEHVRPEQEQQRAEDSAGAAPLGDTIATFVVLDAFQDEEGDYSIVTFEELGVNNVNDIIATVHPISVTDADDNLEPVSVAEAMAGPDAEKWRDAMRREIEQFNNKNTWVETTLPDRRRAITAKWVFKRKRDADGNITKFKARLVARGFTQIHGVDYDETYAPVARMSSLRLLFTIAAIYDLELGQIDVEGAYLNGVIEEEIYLNTPPGVRLSDPNADVFRITGSLYGLKQSGRVWWIELNTRLTAMGFQRCPDEWGLYCRNNNGTRAYISAYVDDIICATSTKEEFNNIKTEMRNHWTITDLGEPQYILGVQVDRDRLLRTITLSQPTYVESVSERFNISTRGAGRSAPLPVGSKTYGELLADADTTDELTAERRTYYQEIVGTIQWIAGATRPDMAFSASFLGRARNAPTERTLALAERALSYLAHTKTTGITLGGKTTPLEVYADADHASCLQTRRSTTGIVAYFHDSPVTWSSRRQATVSQSSAEAEFIAASEGAREAIWLRRVLDHLGFPQQGPTPLYIDNEAAIKLGDRPTAFPLNKHIDIRKHMLREYVSERYIKLRSIKTSKQCADVLTKPLAGPSHQIARTHLRLTQIL